MSTPVQLALQEAFILATGHLAYVGQLAWYDAVVARTADYGGIRPVANG